MWSNDSRSKIKFTRLLLVVMFVTALSETTFAFDRCEAIFNNHDDLSRQIGETAVRQAPVKYYSLARSIKLVTKGHSETLIPFAGDQQGTKVVVFPPLFAKVMCNIALATFIVLEHEDQEGIFDQAAEAAAKCFDAGGSQKTCLVGFGDELAKQYRKAFAELPDEAQETAFSLYESALHQVAMHEYAHHFLDHFARIKTQKITRTDAEFEADLFAVLNGLQSADPVSAMYYFFGGVARIEHYTKKLATNDYESGSCRASNVDNITTFIGMIPISLLDAAYGGGYTFRRNSPSAIRSDAKKQFTGEPPDLKPGSCGRIAKVALGDAFKEQKQLYERMEKDLDFLFAKEKDLDVTRANRLLRDLSEMTKGFRYMDGVAAKSMALMLRNWGLKGRNLTPLIAQVDRLLDTSAVTDNFLSEDFGRLLQAQGLATLQERADLMAQSRMDRSFSVLERAVFYNPAQSESWINLAFIAFKRGDCAAAASFIDHAAATLSPAETERQQSTEFLARKVKEWSRDPERCRAEGAKFHPYPGL